MSILTIIISSLPVIIALCYYGVLQPFSGIGAYIRATPQNFERTVITCGMGALGAYAVRTLVANPRQHDVIITLA